MSGKAGTSQPPLKIISTRKTKALPTYARARTHEFYVPSLSGSD